jgi:predicted MPP superfamily phosphohydrolase
MISRRQMLKSLAAVGVSGIGLGVYGFGIEPILRLSVTRYRLMPPHWPQGMHLRLAVLADLHAGEPYMSLERIAQIVARTNAVGADAILLLGDYGANHRFLTRRIAPAETAGVLAGLAAPLGVHAVLGNHDWWDDRAAQTRRRGPTEGGKALQAAGIPVYENDAVRLVKDGQPFWLLGLGDQIAFVMARKGRRMLFKGVDDLPGTLAKVTDGAPAILMAHEPDIFPKVPNRVALTICGHTHGGQVRLFGYSPIVPSRYGNRFAYGHVVEGGRNLIVSGGLGCSKLPVRFGMPPEIVVIELGAPLPVSGRPHVSPA